MFRLVELPLWLLVLILGFAAVTFASHFLFPSVRWFFRRRMERAVAAVNKRLATPIQPFKLARRGDTIQRLIYDRDVLAAISEHADQEGVPEAVAHERAKRYAREIVPGFSASLYFGFAIRAAKWISRVFYNVKVTHYDRALNGVNPDATVVFVMNHRSNMDYVLVTYLASVRTALSYAVGEWARIWPLRWLIRPMGGYFVRRKASNDLYRKVLGRYVAMATEGGVTQAVFPEGKLSRDGHLQEPKLGILSYIFEGFDPEKRDVVFVPVGLNFDRVLEDRTLLAAGKEKEQRFQSPLLTIFQFIGRHLRRLFTGKFRKYGTAGVGFGAPLSLTEFLSKRRKDPMAALGKELMTRIAAEVPVLPVPLVAQELTKAKAALSVQEITAGVSKYTDQADKIVQDGLEHLKMRSLIQEHDGLVSITEGEEEIIGYYANSIAHLPKQTPKKSQPKKSSKT